MFLVKSILFKKIMARVSTIGLLRAIPDSGIFGAALLLEISPGYRVIFTFVRIIKKIKNKFWKKVNIEII